MQISHNSVNYPFAINTPNLHRTAANRIKLNGSWKNTPERFLEVKRIMGLLGMVLRFNRW